jgi:hypothetical protein
MKLKEKKHIKIDEKKSEPTQVNSTNLPLVTWY